MKHTNDKSINKLTRAQKAALTLKERYGEDYFTILARKAGAHSTSRPFQTSPGLARRAVNKRWENYRAKKALEEQTRDKV